MLEYCGLTIHSTTIALHIISERISPSVPWYNLLGHVLQDSWDTLLGLNSERYNVSTTINR